MFKKIDILKLVKVASLLIVITVIFFVLYVLLKLLSFYQAGILFLWSLFLPFLIAIFIAYLLHPIVAILTTYHVRKPFAILFIYCLFFGGIAFSIYQLYPVIYRQLIDLREQLPQFIRMYEEMITEFYESTSFLPEAFHEQVGEMIATIEDRLEQVVGHILRQLMNIFDWILLITVIPVLVFYFLKDYDQIKTFFKKLIPRRHHAYIVEILHITDEKLGYYIRGQLLVSLFIGLMSYLLFSFLKIEYPMILAIILGITNIIPYFGPILGMIPVVLLTLTHSTKLVFAVIIAIIFIQMIENNFISPYILGKSTNLHPVTIIFILLFGGKIFGILGMILAVPFFTIVREIVGYTVQLYREH